MSDDLVPVIKAVQKKAGLKADGVIGPRTVGALAGNVARPTASTRWSIALEQLRWLPSRSRQTARLHQPAGLHRELHRGRRRKS